MRFIERLKRKSSVTKAQFAFAVAVIATSVVAFVWSTTLPARFASFGTSTDDIKSEENASGPSFTELYDETKSQIGAAAGWNDAKETNVSTSNMDALKNPVSEEGGTLETTSTSTSTPATEPVENSTKGSSTPKTVLIEVKKSE